MNKIVIFFGFLFFTAVVSGQELRCEIVVNADQTGDPENSVFRTLQNSLTEFVNQQKWTDRNMQPHERINCRMFLNISSFDGDSFSGTIQVQSSRPVYGSSMETTVFNFNDEEFRFDYTEYETLDYNASEFRSNLVSVISFYVYTILGLDADTFRQEGGTEYFREANQIVGAAGQSNRSGWSASGGSKSRYRLNTDLLSNAFRDYRLALYTYHREGLDEMHRSPEEGKKGIHDAILSLDDMNRSRPNSLLLRTFFDAKADEIEQIFSGGPSISVKEVVDALNNMAPTFSENWTNISY